MVNRQEKSYWLYDVLSRLEGGQTFSYGIFGKLGYAVDIQLFHDMLAVGMDSFYAQVKLGSNLFYLDNAYNSIKRED